MASSRSRQLQNDVVEDIVIKFDDALTPPRFSTLFVVVFLLFFVFGFITVVGVPVFQGVFS
jgi:hypothetical protein